MYPFELFKALNINTTNYILEILEKIPNINDIQEIYTFPEIQLYGLKTLSCIIWFHRNDNGIYTKWTDLLDY